MEHTKEPWSLGEWIDDQERYIDAVNGDKDLNFTKWEGLAVVFGSDDFPGGHEKCEANARRIVACVNALQGVDTETLEKAISLGIVDVTMGNMFSSRMKLQEERDDAIRAIGVEATLRGKAEADRDAALAMARELVTTLSRVRDEMEASGGWDGDEEVFSNVVAAITKAEALNV